MREVDVVLFLVGKRIDYFFKIKGFTLRPGSVKRRIFGLTLSHLGNRDYFMESAHLWFLFTS